MRRLFKGLRRAPDSHYDVVIIGSGIGGLIAGNLLVRSGLRVLLLEQHYMVGGYCSTFRRGHYTFDAATHFYPLLGNPHTLTGRLLQELGVETGWIKMDPVDTFHFPDGSRFAVPADFTAYRALLDGEFPHEREALDRFFEVVREAYLLGLLHYFKERPLSHAGRLAEYRNWTLRDALDFFFKDPKLKLLLTADCPHWGSPPSRTSFVFDSMLRLSYFLGNFYPRGGSQAFSDELARRFEEQGGHLLINAHVSRIVTERGRARGVEFTLQRGALASRYAGGVVAAEQVIANGDLRDTFLHLLGPKVLPPEALAPLDTLRTTFPCWLTHLGLRDVPAAVLEEAQGYYWDGWDFEAVGRGALRFKLFSPTLYDPAVAPPGGQVLIVQKVLEMDYDRVADWPAHKAEMERFIYENLERTVPGICEHIVAGQSASARTSWRFTLNLRGAMLGWEMSPDQLGEGRPGVETPIQNLFCVGHWTRPGGGITPVIVSAERVVERILAERRRMAMPAVGASACGHEPSAALAD